MGVERFDVIRKFSLIVVLLFHQCASAEEGIQWQPSTLPTHPLSQEEECNLKPGQKFRECEGCPEMVVIGSGSFSMGSPDDEPGREMTEGIRRQVRIPVEIAMGETNITVDEFSSFVASTGYTASQSCSSWDGKNWSDSSALSWRHPSFPQTGAHPVVCVSWNDAVAFVGWLERRTAKAYRLPSEAEWEYAARAGSAKRYAFGDDEKALCRFGNGADQTAETTIPGAAERWNAFAPCTDGYAYTSPVNSFPTNAFGLFDMIGNVTQWVEDCWHSDFDGAPSDGSPWLSGNCDIRVRRGGSWYYDPPHLRSATRQGLTINTAISNLGFRVARRIHYCGS